MSRQMLTTMTYGECWALLRDHRVGRVIYTEGALPACTPVNYALYGSGIVFRTSPDSRLATATRDAVVAFEVDSIDHAARSGWSVLVTGMAEAVRTAGTLVRLDQLGLVSWAGGDRSHWVRIVPSLVVGRRLDPLPPVPAPAPTHSA